jgi:hypothetical protein
MDNGSSVTHRYIDDRVDECSRHFSNLLNAGNTDNGEDSLSSSRKSEAASQEESIDRLKVSQNDSLCPFPPLHPSDRQQSTSKK